LPGSKRYLELSICALALGACSEKNIVAVDPYPCAEAGAVGCTPGLLDGLVGYWRLNDAAGSTIARDWSGWSNTGSLVGIDPATAWIAGGPAGGGTLAIDGTGYINVAPSASIDSIKAQLTVAAWFYLDGTIVTSATGISRQLGNGVDQHYHLSLSAQAQPRVFVTTKEMGQIVIFGPTAVPEQTWLHLAATYDGQWVLLYLNGAEIGRKALTGSLGSETNPVILSGNGNGAAHTVSEPIPGRLSEVMLYQRALGPDEIARLQSGALLPASDLHADGGAQ